MRFSILFVTTQFYVRAAHISFHFTASTNATQNEYSPKRTDGECEILANATEEPKPYDRMQDAPLHNKSRRSNRLMGADRRSPVTFAYVDK